MHAPDTQQIPFESTYLADPTVRTERQRIRDEATSTAVSTPEMPSGSEWRARRMRTLGVAACEKNRLRNLPIRVEQPLGLDLESGVPQPGCHLVRLTAVDMDLHRVAAITLCLQPRHVTDVKPELHAAS